MPYIGRRLDGSIYGVWASEQPKDEFHTGMEHVAENHPDLIAFRNRPRPEFIDPRDTKMAELEARLVALERLV